ncbi:hypothetical protein IWZ00DRAFT_543418 [Phyllosticta capitalensis]
MTTNDSLHPLGIRAWGQKLQGEIHAASPDLVLEPYPFLLVPSSASTPLRYVMGIQRGTAAVQSGIRFSLLENEDEGLPTRLTCALQTFVAHCTQQPQFPRRVAGGGAGVWINARHLAREHLPSPTALQHLPIHQSSSGNGEQEDGRVFLDSTLDPTRPQEQTLPLSAIAAIQKSLRLPSADPVDPVPAPVTLPDVPYTMSPLPPGDESIRAASLPAAGKLRPIQDILSRLTHDASLGGPAAFVIGYADRFDGVKEVRADRWIAESTEEEWVPLHRVRYVRRVRRGERDGEARDEVGQAATGDGEVVWWREGRWDAVFGSGATARREGV